MVDRDEFGAPRLGLLLAAKIVCCGALLLAVTQGLTLAAFAVWFREGGFAWFAFAAILIAAFGVWRLRARQMSVTDVPGRRHPPGKAGARE